MKFSTRTRYALRLMVELALSDRNTFVSLKDVAGKQDISIKYLEQIIPHLTRAGLVTSSRGPRGGYKLAHAPSAYTPGDIIRAIEGNLAPIACLECSPNACARADQCTTLKFWSGLHQSINAYLDSITLEELAHSNKKSP